MNPNQEKNLSNDQNTLVRISPRGSVASQQPTEANSILGKRTFSISEDALTKLSSNFDKESAQNSNNNYNDEDSNESEDKKHKRLLQNRKSAKKCRQKKKAEFVTMQQDVVNLQQENKVLKEKVNDITMMLYNKIEENANIQRKLDQALLQNQMVMTQILASNNNGNNANSTASSLFASPQLQQQDSVGIQQANLYGMPTNAPMMQQQPVAAAPSPSANVLNLLQAVMSQQQQKQLIPAHAAAAETKANSPQIRTMIPGTFADDSANGSGSSLTTGAQNLIKKLLASKSSSGIAANASSSSGASSPLSSSMKNTDSKQ